MRQERDRVLDLLEREERQQQAREESFASQQRNEEIQNRKNTAQAEIERLKAAKDMQRKMGKALLRDIAGAKEKQVKVESVKQTELQPEKREGTSKKNVSFADQSEIDEDVHKNRPTPDWGDVTLARLRSSKGPTLMEKAQPEKRPVKQEVVERMPTGKAKAPDESYGDSDDESEPPASPISVGSDEEEPPLSDVEDEMSNPGDMDLETETDLDFADHQREIALEYHRKRTKISQAALVSHTHQPDDDHREVCHDAICVRRCIEVAISDGKRSAREASHVAFQSYSSRVCLRRISRDDFFVRIKNI